MGGTHVVACAGVSCSHYNVSKRNTVTNTPAGVPFTSTWQTTEADLLGSDRGHTTTNGVSTQAAMISRVYFHETMTHPCAMSVLACHSAPKEITIVGRKRMRHDHLFVIAMFRVSRDISREDRFEAAAELELDASSLLLASYYFSPVLPPAGSPPARRM